MEIAIYTFCMMYSPGPVNLLALNGALKGHGWALAGYCVGVGLAMFTGFLILGYAGEAVVSPMFLTWLAVVGSVYILYLAYRLWTASISIDAVSERPASLRLRNGYLLQLLNPKGFVVILPVTTIMFPAAQIDGLQIVVVAVLISLGAMGAPGLYVVGGTWLGRRFAQPRFFHLFNRAMAGLLVCVALSIFYDFFIAGSVAGGSL